MDKVNLGDLKLKGLKCATVSTKKCVKCNTDIDKVYLCDISVYRKGINCVVRIQDNNILLDSKNLLHDTIYDICKHQEFDTIMMSNYICDCGTSWVHVENSYKGRILSMDILIGEIFKNGVDFKYKY